MKGIAKALLNSALLVGIVAGSAATATAQVLDAAELLATVDPQITISLNGDVIEGEVLLTAISEETEVAVNLAGAPAETTLAGVLLAGVCAEDGDVIAQLGTIEVDAAGKGQLRAALPIDLETIASAPVSVQLWEAEQAPGEALACGEHVPGAQ